MKEIYEAPIAEIEVFETEDVLAISINKTDRGSLVEIKWSDLN